MKARGALSRTDVLSSQYTGFAAWCKLHDAHGGLIAEDGQSAARMLLIYQTPADLVLENVYLQDVPQRSDLSAYPSAQTATETEPCGTSDAHTSQPATVQHEKRSSCTLNIAPGVDHRWQQKYNQHLWFHFTPAQLADWYNERNRVGDILPPEKNGMGLASWRGEHTASVGLREDGWVDFGASARRADGKQDGGDALELIVQVTKKAKPEVMREIARQLVSAGREAVESAAQRGEQPPKWVQVFMSKAGWEHYHQLREEAGHSDQAITVPAPHTGGIVGCYSPNHDDPASQTHHGQEQRQLDHLVPAVPSSNPMQALAMLEAIKDYGQACEWAALFIDGEEIIPAGRSNWLQFVWLSQQKDRQRNVYAYLQDRSQL